MADTERLVTATDEVVLAVSEELARCHADYTDLSEYPPFLAAFAEAVLSSLAFGLRARGLGVDIPGV